MKVAEACAVHLDLWEFQEQELEVLLEVLELEVELELDEGQGCYWLPSLKELEVVEFSFLVALAFLHSFPFLQVDLAFPFPFLPTCQIAAFVEAGFLTAVLSAQGSS